MVFYVTKGSGQEQIQSISTERFHRAEMQRLHRAEMQW